MKMGGGGPEGRASGKGVAGQVRKSFCCWGSQEAGGGAAGFTFVVLSSTFIYVCRPGGHRPVVVQ